jgi:hypothetical protein
MNKAELYARYDNYGEELEVISNLEFMSHSTEQNRDSISHYGTGSTECYEIRLDGVTYLWYSCTHNVGWQGDVEAHSFFCKKKTITKAKMEEISELFS